MSKELKALAEAATPGPWVQWVGNAAVFAGTPEVNREGAILPGDGGRIAKVCEGDLFDPSEQELADHAYIAAANPAAILELLAERDALLAERDAARMRVRELDLLFGRYLLAMKAAVIDADQRGDEEGMRWIYNSLEGPGELPAEDEIDAQAFFDREIKPINDAMAELFAALQGEQP
ncbi:hypothetical protein [Stutzerimonas nitrititolerans]|uniref:hypothetical protein n=1 Tax=Stutzerimonas nitrititolerans TaxID=2482751 RepID=UPI0028AFF530|nr:hypothetical protein [Stutzerimonas nitrititolerans]